MEPDEKRKQAIKTLMLDRQTLTEEELEEYVKVPAFDPIKSTPVPTVKISPEIKEEVTEVPFVEKVEPEKAVKQKTEQKVEQKVEQKQQIIAEKEKQVEISNLDFINEICNFPKTEQKADKKNKIDNLQTETKTDGKAKFRNRLIAIGYVIIIGICAGWVIGNSIAIHNQANALNLANTSYEVNVAKYVMKLSQLDGIEVEDDTDSFSPITSAIELQPEPLSEPYEETKTSNWFDKLCNWLSKLFRG